MDQFRQNIFFYDHIHYYFLTKRLKFQISFNMDNFVPEEDIVTVTNFEVIIPSIAGQFEEHCEIYSSEF